MLNTLVSSRLSLRGKQLMDALAGPLFFSHAFPPPAFIRIQTVANIYEYVRMTLYISPQYAQLLGTQIVCSMSNLFTKK